MTDTQTVAGESNAETKSQAEDKGAQEPTIDDLLKEFEASENPTEQQTQKTDLKADDIREVVGYVREEREQKSRERTDTDVAAAADIVKGDLGISKERVIDSLYGKANRDPRFLRAFQQRHENPNAWNSVLRKMHDELASDLKPKVDENLTDDRAAVEAAVRSQSTGSTEEPLPDLGSMSDAEFNEAQRKLIPR